MRLGTRARSLRGAAATWLLLALAPAACGMGVDLGGSAPGDGSAGADSATCATFAGPAADASCGACSKSSSTCQPNGCFNGYFCDVSEHDCKAPGTPCSGTAKFDAQ